MSALAELDIQGAGGGKSAKGGGGKEANDTLRSNARARFAELWGEGRIKGLVNGAQSIFFDTTPLQNADGSFNFKGVTFEQRLGLPDQPHMPGLPVSETPHSVEVKVGQATGPVTRTIVDADADSVAVVVRVPALMQVNDKGEILGHSLAYGLSVRSRGVVTHDEHKLLFNQKTSSPWQSKHVLPLKGEGPWEVRVERLVPDSTSSKISDELFWESYTVITEGKFTYPNTAYIFMEVDAEQFGSSLPARTYELDGLEIQVPTNYDPTTRGYVGIWDGTFRPAWSNNPAWVFYDLLTNDRYGIGEFIDARRIDKWSLYEIAKYCDELVPSGFKHADGTDIMEPRFTYNGVINTREEAFTVLRNITSAFRGMAFWALGQVYAVSDRPSDYVMQVTPANVLRGEFKYSGTSKKSRHSVAMVSWNDQTDMGRAAVEIVINEETLLEYGWRETSVVKHGCTSRGEAHRFGKWILDTEQHEFETVEYTAGWDHANLRPFDIVAISDPRKAQVRAGGRIAAVSPDRRGVTLDSTFEFLASDTHTLGVTMPTGQIERLKIVRYSLTEEGQHHVVLEAPLSQTPEPNAVWLIAATSVNPRQYRVLTVTENDENDGQFTVTGLFHDPLKYARVEHDIILDPIQYTRPTLTPPPLNAQVIESQFLENGVAIAKMMLSWTPGSALATRHQVTVRGPRGDEVYNNLTQPSLDIFNVVPGLYTFQIRSFGVGGVLSQPLLHEHMAVGWGGLGEPQVLNLRLPNGGVEFVGRDAEILWDNFLPQGQAFYLHNVVDVYDSRTGALRRSEIVHGQNYVYTFDRNQIDGQGVLTTDVDGNPILDSHGKPVRAGASRHLRFEVRLVDVAEKESKPAVLTVHNPAPETPVPEAFGGINQIFLSWVNPSVTDFVGTLVWIEEEPNFDPIKIQPTLDTSTSVLSWPAENGKTRYIRIACYDSFGKDDLNYSPQVQATPLTNVVDVIPPARPTGFKATSELTEDGRARVIFTWDPVPDVDEDLAGYQLEVRELFATGSPGNFVSFQTNETTYELIFEPGTRLEARLNAFDTRFNRSLRTEIIMVDVLGDEEPPALPAGVRARGSFRSLWITWDPNTERDLAGYEVSFLETDAMPVDEAPAEKEGGAKTRRAIGDERVEEEETPVSEGKEPDPTRFRTTSPYYVYQNVGTGGSRFVRVRAFDTSGNFSEWTDALEAKTVSAPELYEDLDINLPAPVDVLPRPIPDGTPKKLILATDGLVYVQHDGDWEVETSAKLITGKVSGQQIEELAITREKIAKEAIGREEIGFGEVGGTEIDNGAISTPKLRSNAIDARKIRAEAIQTHHLSTGAVVAEKIDAGAVTADKIAAFSIAAQHLTASIIGTDQIIAGAITADKLAAKQIITLSAQIEEAIIDDAHIVNLNAAKLTVTDVEAGRVLVAGVNRSTTTIDPGRIKIAGPITLQDWRAGPDSTEINGGVIAANTIRAEMGVFGMRGVTIEGIEFEHNSPSFNRVAWTSGTVRYVGDDGNTITRNVSASNATFSGSVLYLCYAKGATSLSVSTTAAVVGDPNTIVLATYSGNTNLVADKGRTIIDGEKIKTGTVQAAQIAAGAIQSDKIAAGQIAAGHLAANSIASDKIQANAVRAVHIQAGSISADKIAVGNVSGNHIAEGAITGGKIANGAIESNKLAHLSVQGHHIGDRQIWADHKISLSSITGTLITPNAISTPHIMTGAVNADKIAARAINADHLNVNTIRADHIEANSITTAKINTGAVSGFVYGEGMYGYIPVNGGTVVVLYWISATINSGGRMDLGASVNIHLHDRSITNASHPFVLRQYYQTNTSDHYTYQCEGSGLGVYTGVPVGTIGITVQCSHGFARWLAINYKR